MAKKGLVLGIVLLSLIGLVTLQTSAFGSLEEVKWSQVNIPTQGKAGNGVLASGSDIKHPVMATDGTIYAYGEGITHTLYKSTDGGSSWSYCDQVSDAIADIALSPVEANIIYYATKSSVYKSTDGGNNFVMLAGNPGGAGSNNIEITSIDVAYNGSHHTVAVGIRDADPSQYGGVYTLDEATPFSSWSDTGIGNYDVYAVSFSPDFITDQQLVAAVTDETDTQALFMENSGWGSATSDARLNKDNSPLHSPIAVQNRAAIAFPNDYDSRGNCTLFVAIDTGSDSGDVYMIEGMEPPDNSVAIDLNAGSSYGLQNLDFTSLQVTGNTGSADILAGAARTNRVYWSDDGGSGWRRSQKSPTGGSETCVLVTPDYLTSGLAYAATSGNGSAFSYTLDSGLNWNQTGLVDTAISNIVDLALSPDFDQDNTLFMLTHGSEESLWRSEDDGENWERILSRISAGTDSLTLLGHSPESGSQTLFVAGSSAGQAAVWKSSDNGQTFSLPLPTSDPTSGANFPIDTWTIQSDDKFFIGSYDGLNGLIYRTSNGGLTYAPAALAGTAPLETIVLSPDYKQDKTILTGNTNGWVYLSTDNGDSFEPLPLDATLAPLTGSLLVSFDPDFGRNQTVYAASLSPDEGMFRFIIDSSNTWKGIDGTLPTGSIISGLEVCVEGVLYAPNATIDRGMERSLNPTYSLGPTFETVKRGLEEGTVLSGLWLAGNRLWSIDSANIRLMTFLDTLTGPVTPVSPADESSGTGTVISGAISDISLDWDTLKGASSYRWQLDSDTDFSTIPAGFEGTSKASQSKLPELMPASTYYWRVRTVEPVLSPWSEKWSFTTSLGTQQIGLELLYPEAGSSGVPIKPLFQWGAISGAEAYEFILSTDPGFSNPVILKTGSYALPDTAWQCNINLDYDTTYYWKVKATGAGTSSAWSASGAFTTTSPPTISASHPQVPAPPPSPSEPPAAESTPDWVKYLIGALLLVIILLIFMVLTLVLITRRT